jgi:deoxyadenosine/deoxycytidine kinase
LEANIGAGKTTFLNKLRARFSDRFNDIPEPLEDWICIPQGGDKNILGLLYEDPKRYGYTFQHNAFFTRVDKTVRLYDDSRLNITERSVTSDFQVFAHILHDEGNMNANEWDIYLKWKDFLLKTVPITTPAFHIYMRLDPSLAYERIIKRNRKEECGIPYEYIVKVHEYHERWMASSKIPVLVLDASLDFESDDDIFDAYVQKIIQYSEKYNE